MALFCANQVWSQGSPKNQEVGTPEAMNSTIDDKETGGKETKQEFKRFRSVVYAKTDNKDLLCDIYVPKGQGPFPAILLIHGGAWKSGTKLQMKGHGESAAEQGFVAVSINYRHAPKYKWPAQIDDCRQAIQWMANHSDTYKIDPKRIAVWGYSAGGHLASFLATSRQHDRKIQIRCAVCGGSPVDLTLVPKDFPFLAYFMGATRREAPRKYEQASPITHLTKDDPPIFFYHGEQDLLVPVDGIKKMIAKARNLGVQCELMMVPNKEHILTFFDQASFDKALDFVRKQVGSRE